MPQPPRITGVLETALYVANVERAARFYEVLFGFRRLVADQRLCALSVADRQVLLLFKRGASAQPVPWEGVAIPPHDGSGPLHFAFSIAAGELDSWEQRLAAKGVAVETRIDWPRGGRSIYFRDPDGNLGELATPGIWEIF
jgi:catechol 2,3-dioxygenase-like lactoylglutathione lyase family enzyme